MSSDFTRATAVPLPAHNSVSHTYPVMHLADAFAIALPAGSSGDAEQLARFMFAQQPVWISALLRLRDLLVAGFGLKTAAQLAALGEQGGAAERVSIFKVYSRSAHELVMGEDDSHLDFRVSVQCSAASPGAADGAQLLVVSTVVHCHNRLGRAYILLIAPFHRRVVQATLQRAARLGWPSAAGHGGTIGHG